MRRIAVEEAFITPEILDGWKAVLDGKNPEPGFVAMGNCLLGPTGKPLFDKLLDLGPGRVAHMDAVGIDVQVLSLTAPGVQVFHAAEATRLAAKSNDVLAEAVKAYPTRFAGLIAIAPQDCTAAVREMERGAKILGGHGVIINSHTNGEYLDLPKYWPILEAAEAFDLPIYLHPREPGPQMVAPFLDYGLYFATWGFSAETGLHAMRLIMSGTLERFPRLRIVLGHLGEGIPYYLPRIDNRYALQVKLGATAKLPKKPSEYFRENFYVTTAGITFLSSLRLCLDELGAERVLFAADYPYEDDGESVRFIDGTALSVSERRQICETNAVKVFKLRA